MSFIIPMSGWPGVIVSVSLSSVGLAFAEPRLVALGAVFGLPFLSYLAGTPRFALAAVLVAALYITVAVLAWQGQRVASVLAFAVCVVFFAYVARVVLQ